MLNIPETVKTLFKADGIRKNFRVHFPNGELPDITNENIVQESVKFTESLCSQDVLKFGLTEASVIEFETVGVANMYGMTIEAGIEIDLSSLSAAEIAEIAAGSWDGVYVSETDTDIGFPFFRVPYGIFRVESCPRDHQAMTHRQVQAYSASSKLSPTDFEQHKLGALYISNIKSYNPELSKLVYSAIPAKSIENDPTITKTQKALNTSSSATGNSVPQNTTLAREYFGTEYVRIFAATAGSRIGIEFRRDQTQQQYANTFAQDSLYGLEIEISKESLSDFFSTIQSRIEALSPPPSDEYIKQAMRVIRNRLPIEVTLYSDLGTHEDFFPIDRSQIIYPVCPGAANTKLHIYQTFDFGFEICYKVGQTVYSKLVDNRLSAITDVKLYEYTGVPSSALLSFENTSQTTKNGNLYNSFTDCYDLTKILNGYLELNAMFGKMNRDNNFKMVRLDNNSSEAILPSIYSGFWWDEFDVLPIGQILYKYKSEGNKENSVVYVFGEGGSIYDMEDNDVLNQIKDINEETVVTLLDDNFIPNLDPIAFTPVDLDMKGLPYLEAGDYLAVTAGDGVTAYSFAMRQEISGVQVLTAHIESTSGDIIESGESE